MPYIRFDVDKIKDFVFESYKPTEVTGASEMVKMLDDNGSIMNQLIDHFKDAYPKIIYARGGGGLIEVRRDEKEVCEWLINKYEEKVNGCQLTAVHCPDQEKVKDEKNKDNFKITNALLHYNLRNHKNRKALDSLPSPVVRFFDEKEPKNPKDPEKIIRRCDACNKRVGKKIGEFSPTETLYYCDICHQKRKKGMDMKTDVNSFEDLLEIPGSKDSTRLLMIYGDLNEAGKLFAEIEDKVILGKLSQQIYTTLTEIRQELGRTLAAKGIKSLMPVAGGDDLIIIVHPTAFESIKDTIHGLEEQLQNKVKAFTKKKLKMNFSFLTAKHKFPIYNFFQVSEELLKLTKTAYYKENTPGSGKTHYGFYRLQEGSLKPGARDVYQKESFFKLFEFAQKIHRNDKISASAIYRLLDLLPVIRETKPDDKKQNQTNPQPSKQEERLNIDYHLSRHSALADMLEIKADRYHLKNTDDLQLTRDIWEDVIHLKELFTTQREAE